MKLEFVYLLYFNNVLYDIYKTSDLAIEAKESMIFNPNAGIDEANSSNYRIVPWRVINSYA